MALIKKWFLGIVIPGMVVGIFCTACVANDTLRGNDPYKQESLSKQQPTFINPENFNLKKLFVDVFNPQKGEKVLLMVDLPNDDLKDNPAWRERREMAEEWYDVISHLGRDYGLRVYPIFSYPATGTHNGPMPVAGEMGEEKIPLEEIMSDSNIVIAMTEYSATAPLVKYSEKYPLLRVASMPMVSPHMEQTALTADYASISRKGEFIAEKLDDAVGARLRFSTGHELYIDLRYRTPKVDGGKVHPGQVGMRVINLPSGEAYIAPYEGERQGTPSLTVGAIPVLCGEYNALIIIKENLAVDVQGDLDCATEIRNFFDADEARRNVAELGFGLNDKAVITGNVLEDEKVWGVHLAAGRSDHIGGVVGVEAFSSPDFVVHKDIVYPFGGQLEVEDLVLLYENDLEEPIIENAAYIIFDP
jgi:hypothetical protein